MKYFDAEIKHLDGYKFNSGERVKFLARISKNDENDPFIRHGNYHKRVSEINQDDIYDPFNICSSFYDGIKMIDERCEGQQVKLKKKLDVDRILREGLANDWDD